MAQSKTPERVFISYSHDSDDHKQKVLDLATRLREDGVDAMIDQFEEAPRQGWPRWMERQIHDADFVLVVGSKLYHDRLLDEEVDGVGLGAKWEGAILYQHLYEADMKTKGFIPVYFEEEDAKFIPTPLRPFTRYQVGDEVGYEKLYRRVTNQPKSVKPRLGQRRELPTPEVKPGGTMYVGGPIDPELWDLAEWRATFFITGDDDFVPRIGIGFRNKEAAAKIFADWKERYGENDDSEELRVSIIEGEVDGEEPGYTVHIGTEYEKTYRKLSRKARMDEEDLMVSISRLNRMNPPANSENLSRFKAAVRKSKVYHVVSGIISEDRTTIEELGND